MNITVAKTAGFCFGVKKAVEKVYEQIQISDEKIYTFGPIIHNEEVVKDLEEKGVEIIDDISQMENISGGILIIRSHGVEKKVYDMAEKYNIKIVDATCPFVKRIHDIVHENSEKGYHIVIVGNSKHPEVEGIVGWVEGDYTVINSEEDANKFEVFDNKKICIVSQTTFNYNKFKDLVEIISKKGYDIIVLNTICSATEERQTEARQIASEVDAMIVIGGSHSSNTQKLFEICQKECGNTYYIQSLDDLALKTSQSIRCVGITAGASTPNKIIEEVQKHVRTKF